ncbi:homeobox protein araucan-like [Teleopsis dalmanni]|uniref:homeobox protein araucan-like n=1 Tax=Teleopsis dalmanni TaxID=139649 RepID=UPI0018CF120E|nr:homeobox protein araucan-like [Teleopsis dalmanni]
MDLRYWLLQCHSLLVTCRARFLSSNSLTTLTNPAVQSPIAAASNAPSLSPPSVGADSSTSSGDGAGTHSDTLTPDPTSQSSATCVSSGATTNTIDSGTAAYACAVNVNTTTAAPPCCDNGRTIMPESVAGQSFCSYQYDPTRLALSSYGRIQSAAGVGVYSTAYPSTEQNPYPSIGVESAPFYSTLFLSSNSLTTLTNPAVQSPIAAASNAPSLSPPSVGADSSTSSGDGAGTHSDTLTPDPTSQSSATCVSSGATTNTIDSGTAAYACAVNVNTTTAAPPCCDNGRTIMPESVAGQSFCSYQYDPTRLALSSYGRIQSAAGVGVYSTAYPSTEQNPYPSIGVESAPFYSTLSNPYALKDSATGTEMTAWTSAGLQPTTGYYSYDPMSAYGLNLVSVNTSLPILESSVTTVKHYPNEIPSHIKLLLDGKAVL